MLALKNNAKLPKGSVLKDLPIYCDHDDEVIRLQSRLHTAASLLFDFANPIIMPKGIVAEKLAVVKRRHSTHFDKSTGCVVAFATSKT